MASVWGKYSISCLDCGTTEGLHWGKSRCRKCYRRWYNKTPVGREIKQRYFKKYFKSEKGRAALANQKLRQDFGITIEDKRKMWKLQNGKCKICNSIMDTSTNCHVDHNHETKKIRGLLCRDCNIGLGFFKDNMERLTSAINYLKS